MNINDYSYSYELMLRRYEALYAPRIQRELKKQINGYINEGYSGVHSESMSNLISKMHLDIGLYWAKKTYMYSKTEVKKARDPKSLSEHMFQLLRTYMIIDAMNAGEQITETTINNIKDILYAATIANYTLAQINAQLLKIENLKIRAALIARTELVYASNMASYLIMNDSENVWKKRWVALLDNRTRKDHRKLDGQLKNLAEPFEVVNKRGVLVKMNFPGDRSFGAGADQICNCRCFLVYE